MNHGKEEAFHSKTLDNIRKYKFSLNPYESTSNNLQKVLCILVSYFHPESGQVVVEHLESIAVV